MSPTVPNGGSSDLVRLAAALKTATENIDDALQPRRNDLPVAQLNHHRTRKLVAVERLALTTFLQNGQFPKLHPLKGREPGAAIRTETPPPDRRVVFRRARILYLSVVMTAKRTSHRLDTLLPFAAVAFPADVRSEEHTSDLQSLISI